MSHAEKSLRVLAVEPFYGGSHRAYLDGVQRHSRHRWSVLTGKPVHWKWRMRSAPLELSAELPEHLTANGHPDLIWCSDMLDLPQWLGFAANKGLRQRPSVVYFHESQWTYPQPSEARADFHYGYTNLLTALAADKCLFNSTYHRDEFLSASMNFVRRMPDGFAEYDFDALGRKAEVLYPGFETSEFRKTEKAGTLNIGWVSRWEHDKRPDRFVDFLRRLRNAGVEFRLILLGARPRECPRSLETIRKVFSEFIRFDGFAESVIEYRRWLSRMDVVVSTADHEYFGIAICEAIDAGAVPVVPDRLSYPEIVVTPTRYESIDDAVKIIQQLGNVSTRLELVRQGQLHMKAFQMSETVAKLDQVITKLGQLDRG